VARPKTPPGTSAWNSSEAQSGESRIQRPVKTAAEKEEEDLADALRQIEQLENNEQVTGTITTPAAPSSPTTPAAPTTISGPPALVPATVGNPTLDGPTEVVGGSNVFEDLNGADQDTQDGNSGNSTSNKGAAGHKAAAALDMSDKQEDAKMEEVEEEIEVDIPAAMFEDMNLNFNYEIHALHDSQGE